MKIEFKNYTMEASPEGGFHLTREVTREKTEIIDGKKEGLGEYYKDNEVVGYNMRLESCIKKIIHLNHCSIDETVSLKQYMKMYKEYLEEIKNVTNI